MSTTTILNLNDDCLYEIFKQIKNNCELDNALKNRPANYLDLINFTISCGRFVETFYDWNFFLHNNLRIEFADLEAAYKISIDLAERFGSLENVLKRDKERYWKWYFNAINKNKQLGHLVIGYNPTRYFSEHFDRFQDLMNAIRHNRTLFIFEIYIKEYSFLNVPPLGELRELYLDVRMDAEDLVQLCRSNPYLETLSFMNTELYGRFSDIVPYCKKLENLELTMKTDIDASDYAALAKLPELEKLTLRGIPQEGTLVKLFQGLEEKILKRLDIPDTYLSEHETKAISKIGTLTHIFGRFSDEQSIPEWHILKILNQSIYLVRVK
ncbi:uncharacterized protein [Drosophila takahashii]|uniref:uncharacterized protein n=1 Tax=Drosophila takahashii TaxID=29030 RepID=UPI003898E67A